MQHEVSEVLKVVANNLNLRGIAIWLRFILAILSVSPTNEPEPFRENYRKPSNDKEEQVKVVKYSTNDYFYNYCSKK